MGNTQCGQCLDIESEMIAEVLLGKDENKKEIKQNNTKNISVGPAYDKVSTFHNDLLETNINTYRVKDQNN